MTAPDIPPEGVPMTALGREGSNVLGLHPCVGYFDTPNSPCVYDPGWGSTPCLICWRPLGGVAQPDDDHTVRTISLFHGDDTLSLFYRVHVSCANADSDAVATIDGSVMHGPRGEWHSAVLPEALNGPPNGEDKGDMTKHRHVSGFGDFCRSTSSRAHPVVSVTERWGTRLRHLLVSGRRSQGHERRRRRWVTAPDIREVPEGGDDALEETVCAVCGTPLPTDEAAFAHLDEALEFERVRAFARRAEAPR